MRLIDNAEGHLFQLPPENVVLLAPRPLATCPLKPLVTRTLVVYSSDGTIVRWVKTSSGWSKRPV